ncbi:cytochrome b/b6 domain-containing protein [Devosia sp. ZB163]|uniref:cytochrome b/b6 domain-containing protein n=1 Tax=Devosia sp. ZB163 TaxID=3025938 RepID=UPI0023604CA4|nr:cytochrome b/b6 domain-containing protein [Devosia sp. ZB163]MDC9822771.1 cytochrome b/b6 domain-containing protein [Devosia sp. ZB163]
MSKLTDKVTVWDPLVRVLHWALAGSIAVAWFTSGHPKGLHQWAGYTAGALIAIRLVWGFLGPGHARFTSFVRHPRTVLNYLGDIWRGRERRHLGHNPAGGAMIIALMTAVSAQVTIGWLQTTDMFWGVEWIEELHSALAKAILLLIGLHLIGVLVASIRHRENLPAAMITGLKRSAEGDDLS